MIDFVIDLLIEVFESTTRIVVCILILVILCALLGRVADTNVSESLESRESISGEMQ